MKNIRNFCIIAHIDHGKSTIADRLLELTQTVEKRKMHKQFLDQMEIEQERGITIKLQPVTMKWQYEKFNTSHTNAHSELFTLNLIDTPGHIDFTYEVSRSLAACEGAILVVDASQGIQAQTLSNLYMALDQNLEIIPVVNKIDLSCANIKKCEQEIVNLLGVHRNDILKVSAKTGEGMEKLLSAIIERIPPPRDIGVESKSHSQNLTKHGIWNMKKKENSLRALIFDSIYDDYLGVVLYVRIFSGNVKHQDHLSFFSNKRNFHAQEIGIFTPRRRKKECLMNGEVGYIATGLKELKSAKIGDTIVFEKDCNKIQPLPGYQEVKPMVYASFFCKDHKNFNELSIALEKLRFNDASLKYKKSFSKALGYGYRVGFFGLLHMDITQERLAREFKLNLVVASPSVTYKIDLTSGKTIFINNPLDYPDPSLIAKTYEPMADVEILTPKEYIGDIMKIIKQKRGIYKTTEHLDERRVLLKYTVPFAKIISDLHDQVKGASKGYASMNYDYSGFIESDLNRLDVLIHHEIEESFSQIIHKSENYYIAKRLTKKLKDIIPRHQFEIPIQAAVGGKIIARETVRAFRKDVTQKLYGGDRTRKDKLLKKQKKGKKRMRDLGKVDIPSDVYLKVLS